MYSYTTAFGILLALLISSLPELCLVELFCLINIGRANYFVHLVYKRCSPNPKSISSTFVARHYMDFFSILFRSSVTYPELSLLHFIHLRFTCTIRNFSVENFFVPHIVFCGSVIFTSLYWFYMPNTTVFYVVVPHELRSFGPSWHIIIHTDGLLYLQW